MRGKQVDKMNSQGLLFNQGLTYADKFNILNVMK